MSIISKVTWAYMKKNKKRTLVTIFGVIISVAMITAVLTSITSFMDMFQQREVYENGDWIAEFSQINPKQAKELAEDSRIDKVMLTSEVGYSPLENTDGTYSSMYTYIAQADAAAVEDMRVKVSEGRLPENDREIVLQMGIAESFGFKIGETATFNMGHWESVPIDDPESEDTSETESVVVPDHIYKTYTVVGIIETPNNEFGNAWGSTSLTFLDKNTLPSDSVLTARTTFHKVNTKAYSQAEAIAGDMGISTDNVNMHEELLKYYGVTMDSGMNAFLQLVGGFLIVIIMIGSILLIYNAFAISLSERSRQLGMLSSIGATKSQKKQSVFFEGAVIGIISIPLGILAGVGGMAITFKIISPLVSSAITTNAQLRCAVTPTSLISSAVLAALTIFISSWIPASKASRISPIDTIRQSQDIKLTRRQVKTSKLTRVLFGFEGELALKNMKRNKKSYRTTMLSLIVSLSLFLSIAGYVTLLQRSFGVTDDTSNYDVYILLDQEDESAAALCTALPEVDKYNVATTSYENFELNEQDNALITTQEYSDFLQTLGHTEQPFYSIQLWGLDEASLKAYINDAGLPATLYDQIVNADTTGEIPAIIVNQFNMITAQYKWADMKIANISDGQKFALDTWSYSKKNDEGVKNEGVLNLAALATTKETPLGVSKQGYAGIALKAITLDRHVKSTMSALKEKEYINNGMRTSVYLKSSDPEKLTESAKTLCEDNPKLLSQYYSVWESEQGDRSLLLMIQVFCYGFVALMTLICTANILNTISTGIELRRREFAMLKSVGMEPKAFNRMLIFESLFYGLKALLYGVPIGFLVMFLEYRLMTSRFSIDFILPLPYLITAVVVLFIVVGISMAYSFGKIKKENILDGLRTE